MCSFGTCNDGAFSMLRQSGCNNLSMAAYLGFFRRMSSVLESVLESAWHRSAGKEPSDTNNDAQEVSPHSISPK